MCDVVTNCSSVFPVTRLPEIPCKKMLDSMETIEILDLAIHSKAFSKMLPSARLELFNLRIEYNQNGWYVTIYDYRTFMKRIRSDSIKKWENSIDGLTKCIEFFARNFHSSIKYLGIVSRPNESSIPLFQMIEGYKMTIKDFDFGPQQDKKSLKMILNMWQKWGSSMTVTRSIKGEPNEIYETFVNTSTSRQSSDWFNSVTRIHVISGTQYTTNEGLGVIINTWIRGKAYTSLKFINAQMNDLDIEMIASKILVPIHKTKRSIFYTPSGDFKILQSRIDFKRVDGTRATIVEIENKRWEGFGDTRQIQFYVWPKC